MNKKMIPQFFCVGICMVSSAFAYSVKKGDTLSTIAEEHYGNWAKWKSLWQQNSGKISNPNLIYPGQILQFSNEIPNNERLLVASNSSEMKPTKSAKGGSQEWRLLPPQSWEKFTFHRAPEVDPDGFDRRSRVAKRIADKTSASITVASDRLAISGEIISARTEYGQIFLGEQVFIRAEEQLQVGMIYSVSSGPQKITSARDRRVGFAYDLAGKIRIIGVRDGLFIGTVISLQRPIQRNNLLIPAVKPLQFTAPVASPNVISASVMTTDFLNSSLLGEQQLVILDVGTDEGVKPGMIFRHYLKDDPSNNQPITTKDYLIESELQVLSVTDKFSIAIILQSRSLLHPNDSVLSLMDLRDFKKNSGLQTFIQDYDYSTPLDDLDQLDDSQGLGEKEDRELRQLENVDPKAAQDGDLSVEPVQDPGIVPIGEEPAPNDQVDKSINAKPPAPSVPETAPAVEENDLDKLDAPKDENTDMVLDAPEGAGSDAVLSTPDAPATNELPADLSVPADPIPEAVPAETPKKK